MKKSRVAVIGSGAAGLAAAFRLKQAGFDVVVLESAQQAGGRVQSVQRDGYIFDLGADANSTGYLTYLALTHDAGLDHAISPISSVVGTVVDGRVRYMDVASKLSLALTSTFSLAGKIRLARGMKEIAHDLAGIDFRELYKSARLDDPYRSAEAYGLRHFGVEGNDYMIDPLARLMQSTGADNTSILDIAAGLAFANEGMWTFLGGADRLLKTLAAQLAVQFQCKVESVSEHAQGVTVNYQDAGGRSVSEEFDACVIATMYADAMKIYPHLREISPELSRDVQYMRAVKVHLGYDVATKSKGWTIQVPSVEDQEIFVLFLDHNKAPDRAPKGKSLINIQTESKFFEQAMDMSDDEAVDFARRKVEKYLPELAGHYNGICNVERWPRIGHINYPGYYRNAEKLVSRLNQDGRIQVAGDMFSKASQETSAARGELVARNIIRLWQR